MEEERNTTSDCFTYGVPTYGFVSGKDRDHFPKSLFSAVTCKPLKQTVPWLRGFWKKLGT